MYSPLGEIEGLPEIVNLSLLSLFRIPFKIVCTLILVLGKLLVKIVVQPVDLVTEPNLFLLHFYRDDPELVELVEKEHGAEVEDMYMLFLLLLIPVTGIAVGIDIGNFITQYRVRHIYKVRLLQNINCLFALS